MPRSRRTPSVVVITGASSGIGRAAALEFSRRGLAVVLAARRTAALNELADKCRSIGGPALPVTTDVSDPTSVQQLLDEAVDTFGCIDVWLNNAAVTCYGSFEDTPPDLFRRVVETNLFGYVYGARAALSQFRRQQGGVLINNGSIVGQIGQPYTSAYVVSKFAILGLSKCLRQELRGTNIHVCDVLPAATDTPFFQHGGNQIGCAVKPIGPISSAEQVARTIVRLAHRPRRETVIGAAGRLSSWLNRLMPGWLEPLVAWQVGRRQFTSEFAEITSGNLEMPIDGTASISGGWRTADGKHASCPVSANRRADARMV